MPVEDTAAPGPEYRWIVRQGGVRVLRRLPALGWLISPGTPREPGYAAEMDIRYIIKRSYKRLTWLLLKEIRK